MNFVETEKIELKQKYTESLPREIVAFLNTDGGTVYIGISDDGSVCGVKQLDETLKKVADIVEYQILPDPRQFVEIGTKYIDHKHVVEIKIAKGDSLYYVKKHGRSAQGCFVRVGTTCRSMTEQQIETVHNKYLDAKIKITEIASGKKKLTFQYLKLLLTEKGISINERTFAENFHLLTQSGSFNKMAELLADENEVSIKVVRFRGRTKADGIAMRNEYGGKCLVVAMKQAFDYCADVINETRTSFHRGERVDTSLFDREAFREVWFNACLHNNWCDGTPPAIYVYTDRLEVVSTGGLPANLSRADFFRGISKPVNEELARLFIRLDLMEQTGYGIPRITQSYGQDAFEFLDFFLRVTIRFAFEIDAEAIGNEPINANISDIEPINEPINAQTSNYEPINKPTNINRSDIEPINAQTNNYEPINAQTGSDKPINEPTNAQTGNNEPINVPTKNILDIISAFPNMSKEQIAERIGKSRATVTRLLGEMVRQGKIRRVGANKNGHWEVL